MPTHILLHPKNQEQKNLLFNFLKAERTETLVKNTTWLPLFTWSLLLAFLGQTESRWSAPWGSYWQKSQSQSNQRYWQDQSNQCCNNKPANNLLNWQMNVTVECCTTTPVEAVVCVVRQYERWHNQTTRHGAQLLTQPLYILTDSLIPADGSHDTLPLPSPSVFTLSLRTYGLSTSSLSTLTV